MEFSEKKRILIFGGTGSLGKTLVKRLLLKNSFRSFKPEDIFVVSRDEAKHHLMRQKFPNINYIIGDVRNYDKIYRVLTRIEPKWIVNAAAMKQVPACENDPYEALLTNTIGTYNVVKAVENSNLCNINVLSISTDKCVSPINSYGMTKALQERIHINAHGYKNNVFNCVRYGNVLESTGSVIPLFKSLIKENKDLPITHKDMTRFLLSLDEAVELIFSALNSEQGGKIFVPIVKSAKIVDLAEIMLEHTNLKYYISGIRPGEKIDEILISEGELSRTENLGDKYWIYDFNSALNFRQIIKEYSSGDVENLMNKEDLRKFLIDHGVL